MPSPLSDVQDTCCFDAARRWRLSSPRAFQDVLDPANASVPMAFFPFASWKRSFSGDPHAHGKDGVRFYTEQQVITPRFA